VEVVLSTLRDENSCLIERLLLQNAWVVVLGRNHQNVIQPQTFSRLLLIRKLITKKCTKTKFTYSKGEMEVLSELEFVVSVRCVFDDGSAARVGRAMCHGKFDFVHLTVVHQTLKLKFCNRL